MRLLKLGLAAAVLAAAGAIGLAQIQSLTLPEMMDYADDAVVGEIVGKETIVVENVIGLMQPITVLTIDGRSLIDGRATTVDVHYFGGVIDDRLYWSSESPREDETELGREVVAFYSWVDDMTGGHAGNILNASHGSLFHLVDAPNGKVVLGRGDGYAVRYNKQLTELEDAVATLRAAQEEAGR